jgi:uncharacterized protein (DUF1330 family)
MAAYMIGEIEVTDPAAYEDYRKQVLAVVVVLEFPSFEQAQKWYRSPEYAPLIALRQRASRGRLVLVEGV